MCEGVCMQGRVLISSEITLGAVEVRQSRVAALHGAGQEEAKAREGIHSRYMVYANTCLWVCAHPHMHTEVGGESTRGFYHIHVFTSESCGP